MSHAPYATDYFENYSCGRPITLYHTSKHPIIPELFSQSYDLLFSKLCQHDRCKPSDSECMEAKTSQLIVTSYKCHTKTSLSPDDSAVDVGPDQLLEKYPRSVELWISSASLCVQLSLAKRKAHPVLY